MKRIDKIHAFSLHDVTATRQLERSAVTAQPEDQLLRQAGMAVAKLAIAIAPHASKIWIACGSGNNGSDGLEAARLLLMWGKTVIITTFERDLETNCDRRARDAGVVWAQNPPVNHDLCIDAMLGIGQDSRPLSGRLAAWAYVMNTGMAPVLAIDNPTGLNPDTGHLPGIGVVADHTLCLLTLKPGLFTGRGRDLSGQVWLESLGIHPTGGADRPGLTQTAILTGRPELMMRLHATHKGSYGDVGIIGGAAGMTGAAFLAGSAALQAGAGRVFVGLLDSANLTLDVSQPELMLRPPDTMEYIETTMVFGCGGGTLIATWLPKLLASSRRLVIDADAINALAQDQACRIAVRLRLGRGQFTVLTPHPLEAARFLDTSVTQVQSDRLAAARAISDACQCTVVLKGSGTVIATPLKRTQINPTGNARLASAGTGDVLSGMIGAGLAAGLGAHDAASRAVYKHGQVADDWSLQSSLTAGSLSRSYLI